MSVRAVEHGEIAPAAACLVDALKLAGDPARLVFGSRELDDANLFAFGLVGAEHFLGKIRADGVLADDLRGNAQDVGSGAVILGKADTEFRGVLAFAPAGKAFQKELKAAEGSAAKAVDGLIVVTDGENIFGCVDKQL